MFSREPSAGQQRLFAEFQLAIPVARQQLSHSTPRVSFWIFGTQ